jgi:hypothetical protein
LQEGHLTAGGTPPRLPYPEQADTGFFARGGIHATRKQSTLPLCAQKLLL